MIVILAISYRRNHFQTEKIALEYDATLCFLPPYHPVLNPIEYAWSILKRMIFRTRGSIRRNTKEMTEFVKRCYVELEKPDCMQKLANCYSHVIRVSQYENFE